MNATTDLSLPSYRVIQLEWTQTKGLFNDSVADFEDLVTHHPQTNRNAEVKDGVVSKGQPGRSFGLVGGEIQEIEVERVGRKFGLSGDQVLLKKDFILEDPRLPTGVGSRSVDVPSPVSGIVGRAEASSGLVDLLDREGGQVIARVRHMSPLLVERGDAVEYGQALGIQGRQASGAVHVHMEVDMRYYTQYENYMEDLISGRLPLDSARREAGITPRPTVEDGIARIGQSSESVLVVQQVLNREGFRGADGQMLKEDGFYRLSMQSAVINYQQAQEIEASGDLDAKTLRRIAPQLLPPTVNPDPNQTLPPYFNLQGNATDATRREERLAPLFVQAEHAVRQLDSRLGRPYDERSERLAASAACLARENGLTRIDHIVLSQATDTSVQGHQIFVVQGELQNPAHLHARMSTDDALAASAQDSLARLARLDKQGAANNQCTSSLETDAQQNQHVASRLG